jgi:methionine synthase II (cobalamin-independent)
MVGAIDVATNAIETPTEVAATLRRYLILLMLKIFTHLQTVVWLHYLEI